MAFDVVLQQVISAVIGVLASFILAFVVAKLPGLIVDLSDWLQQHANMVASHFTSSQLDLFNSLVRMVIQAVEQKVDTGAIVASGEEKKRLAIQMLQAECDKLGIPFNIASADTAIEAAIKQGLQNGGYYLNYATLKSEESTQAVEGTTSVVPAEGK